MTMLENSQLIKSIKRHEDQSVLRMIFNDFMTHEAVDLFYVVLSFPFFDI